MARPGAAQDQRLDFYPESDGKPMGESDAHVEELADWSLAVLKDHFEPRQDRVYVAGNNFLFYREGDRRAVVSPDVYVVKGVPQRLRRSFKVWEEGGARPEFVLEITSLSTREEDLGEKMMRYRDDLEVLEYFLFDPREEWIGERLRGFRLVGGVYQPIQPDARGRLLSRALGLELAAQDGHLRYFLPGAGTPLPTRRELAAEAEAGRLQAEAGRAQAEAELARERARVAELQAELERLRGGPPG